MPQWKPPTDSNLPPVPSFGTQISPHIRWVAKQIASTKDRTPRQQAWLDSYHTNSGGELPDPRKTVSPLASGEAADAASRIMLSNPFADEHPDDTKRGNAPMRPPAFPGEMGPRPPLPSQAGPNSQQKSMGVRRRRKVTEEEEEEFDASQERHGAHDNAPAMPPPPPPPVDDMDYGLGDDGDDDREDDDDEVDGGVYAGSMDDIERPRDRKYPPPPTSAIQPYDSRMDVMIEKFGQVANQMIFGQKENNFMAQQSALESRRAVEVVVKNANAMMESSIKNANALVQSFQENTMKMLELSMRMVVQADTRRDAAEAAQLRSMGVVQESMARQADARILVAQAEAQIAQANAAIAEINAQEEAPADPATPAEDDPQDMIGQLLGKGMSNALGPLVGQIVDGVMTKLGANGPTLSRDDVEGIAKASTEATIKAMRAQKAAAAAANTPAPTAK